MTNKLGALALWKAGGLEAKKEGHLICGSDVKMISRQKMTITPSISAHRMENARPRWRTHFAGPN